MLFLCELYTVFIVFQELSMVFIPVHLKVHVEDKATGMGPNGYRVSL